jgi:chemotaxis protein methyltransferase CheR
MTPRVGAASASPLSVQDPVPQLLRELVHERIGIYFEADRIAMMLEKLEPRARARDCRSYLDYYYILKYDENGEEEWRRVMDAFSVQETYFWREFDQIRVLTDKIVPAWFARSKQPLRIWTAACATGEEPYSIAMALCEAGWGGHPIEILASDASEGALTKAREGLYRDRSFRVAPEEIKRKYFDREGDGLRLRPEIRNRVIFRWANLMNITDVPAASVREVVFCRNVFIYFSTGSIKHVVDSFAERMPTGGHLFVGASESLLKLTDKFDLQESAGAFMYVRNAN